MFFNTIYFIVIGLLFDLNKQTSKFIDPEETRTIKLSLTSFISKTLWYNEWQLFEDKKRLILCYLDIQLSAKSIWDSEVISK
ncbi:hypothetical protein RCL_jg20697.t1 [Rhizophagus clarus]|uniref:Uncharacterized protein n=1 Tax=Rhizophagus clarus TaxID=94130 RepID=A0A8H3LJW1_9GLOM|nr:hypothetical protein RCL_jg20697.t1 [Rhizophagus clarus]